MLAEFREDLDKQREGTPIHIGQYTFYVRRWGTPESIRERKKLAQRLFGPLHQYTEEDDCELLAHWLAEYGVTGWEEVTDEAGKAVKFTRSNAREVFLDEAMYLSLNNLIYTQACRFENYLFAQVEEDVEEVKKP